jgi:hypothetical protein
LRNEQKVSEQDALEQDERDELDERDEPDALEFEKIFQLRDEPDVLEFEKIFKMSPCDSSRPYHNQEGVLNNDCDGALSARSVRHCASVLVRVLCNCAVLCPRFSLLDNLCYTITSQMNPLNSTGYEPAQGDVS